METKHKVAIAVGSVIVIVAAYLLLTMKNLSNQILIPYIAHQQPVIDPHLPANDPLSDKLDEVLFDGLFNTTATMSGVVYEEGLGSLVKFENNVATLKLNTDRVWHSSYNAWIDDGDIHVDPKTELKFSAEDIQFTMDRIKELGSLSQEYILILQALKNFTFKGPNAQNEIQFEFLSDRLWSDNNIKEILTFKILPRSASKSDLSFNIGTGPYLSLTAQQNEENIVYFYKNPKGNANLENVRLIPFIDNSTFATELSNKNINVMLSTPFGSLSSILTDTSDYFYKSKISTTYFAVFFNTERVPLEKRKAYRAFLNNQKILNQFFKIGTPQQRNITDYLGNSNNFTDYLNYSVFPQSSYYVEEKIVVPNKAPQTPDNSQLSGLDIKVNLNSGLREELNELMTILNNQNLFQNKVKVTAVREDVIASGDYDAVIIPIRGYSSKIRYDLYDLYFRSPDLLNYRVNLRTQKSGNETVLDASVIQPANNFFRINGANSDFKAFLENIYGFMATQHIGDKQYYAGLIDEEERKLATAVWLFSLPELSYYSRQFDENSVQQYGVATQLSTIEKWQETN